jgi:3-oxoacyl-[acyl-carrier protein] reductase
MSSAEGPELVVVTGAGSGMGRDIALDQSARGRHVVLVGRRTEPLEETAAAAVAAGAQPDHYTVVAADASTVSGTETLLTALESLGEQPIIGLVAAAGGQGDFINPGSRLDDVERAWDAALRKNFYSALLPVEALLPRMSDGAGRIVLISSTSALDGRGGPYATAKAALAGYARDLAVRAGTRGITANTVAPGFVAATDFFTAGGFGDSESMIEAAAARTLVGRVGAPADVTAAVRWLLGADAGWVTGQTVVVSGGTDLAR